MIRMPVHLLHDQKDTYCCPTPPGFYGRVQVRKHPWFMTAHADERWPVSDGSARPGHADLSFLLLLETTVTCHHRLQILRVLAFTHSCRSRFGHLTGFHKSMACNRLESKRTKRREMTLHAIDSHVIGSCKQPGSGQIEVQTDKPYKHAIMYLRTRDDRAASLPLNLTGVKKDAVGKTQ